MTSIDSLPSDQRALIELVLRRGRSYRELANLLSVDLAAIRQRACAAILALAPDDLQTPEQHEAITDYLLGQLPEALNVQARGLLASSKTANLWSGAVAAKLEEFAPGRVAEVPRCSSRAADSAAAQRESDPTTADGASEFVPDSLATDAGMAGESEPSGSIVAASVGAGVPSSPEVTDEIESVDEHPPAAATVAAVPLPPARARRPHSRAIASRSNRRPLLLALLVALVLIVIVSVLIVNCSGSGTHHSNASTGTGQITTGSTSNTTATTTTGAAKTTTGAQSGNRILTTVALSSPAGYTSTVGVAQLVSKAGSLRLVLRAQGLPANSASDAYAVWLYSDASHKLLLGFVTPTIKAQGSLTAESALPANARDYKQVLLTLESEPHPTAPGTIVLRGAL